MDASQPRRPSSSEDGSAYGSTEPCTDGIEAWRDRYAHAASDWAVMRRRDHERTSALMAAWAEEYQATRAAQRELKKLRLWRGGPRTLLAALGLQDSERPLVAGLAWLLRPDGHHGLGPAILSGLLSRLGIDEPADDITITREESRGDDHAIGLDRTTKADLVVYASSWTIIFEAKTYAREQHQQLDRLYYHWGREAAPHFVFLTRSVFEPVSAVRSREHWRQLTWDDVVELAHAAIDAHSPVAPGLRDYIETLEVYHRA